MKLDWISFIFDMATMVALIFLVGIFIVVPITIAVSCVQQIFVENNNE